MSEFVATLRHAWGEWWSPAWVDRGAPQWAHWVVTFLFSTVIAVVFAAFGFLLTGRGKFWDYFIVSQCIGFAIHGLFSLGGWLLGAQRINAFGRLANASYFSVIPLLGLVIGYAVGFALIGFDVSAMFGSGRFWLGVIFVWAVLSVVWWRFFVVKLRLAEAEGAREAERARAAELERRALDAQLRTLQAQIEPHFLFNTLANVVSLIDSAPAQARQMLERLIELLRASLAASRAPLTTLGQEADLARAYLDVMALRMGPRLAYEIALPAPLRALPVPPLLVQPLIENAIEHGLEPKVQGGRVELRATAGGEVVQIEVRDDGLGFGAATSSGIGLTNLRERLAAQYGDRARLAIEDAQPGTRVRITLPAT
ncbi:MAG: sensor histidine kinase [Burkholderiales bacterium]|jgi:signal transduction histidine kinase|nr:sensor histidine kinase [Burkholderiales bacterium]